MKCVISRPINWLDLCQFAIDTRRVNYSPVAHCSDRGKTYPLDFRFGSVELLLAFIMKIVYNSTREHNDNCKIN